MSGKDAELLGAIQIRLRRRELLARVLAPRGLDASTFAAMNPEMQAQYQRQEIDTIATDWMYRR